MAHRLWQAYRGTTAQVDAVTPASGEPIWETDGLVLAIGDGSTLGGLHIMMASGAGWEGNSTLAWTATEATAGEFGLKILTTDSVVQTAGIIRSLLVDHNITGAKSGSAQTEGISIDMDIGANVNYAYPLAIYVSKTGNRNIVFLAGAQIYLEDMGTGTIGAIAGLDIQIGSTNLGSRHTGIRLVSHTGTARSGILFEKAWDIGIDFSGTGSGGVAATFSTADIRFQGGTTLLDDGTDLTLAGANLVVPQLSMSDDTFIVFGGVCSVGWETADANANMLVIALPNGGAIDSPTIMIGDQSVLNFDLGTLIDLSALNEPNIIFVDADADAYIAFGFHADDTPHIYTNRPLRLEVSGDTDDYFKFETDTGVPTIFATGSYLRIGDVRFTQHSLDAEDDLMVSGDFEVSGVSFFDGLVTSDSTTGYATTATFVPDATRTNYAFSIGNRAAELTVNLANDASQNLELFQMNVNLTASGGAPTSTSTARLVRVRSTHDTVDMPNLRLMNINTYMDVQKSLQDAYGQMNGIDFYTNAIAIGGEAAVAVFNIDANSAVTGNVRGIIINLHGAGLPSTTSIGLEVRTDGGSAVLAEGIRVWSVGGNSITTGLYLDGTITTDIRLSGGITLVDDGTNLILNVGSGNVEIDTTASQDGFLVKTTSTQHGASLKFQHEDTTPLLNYSMGSIEFYGYDGAGTPVLQRWGLLRAFYDNITDGAEEVLLRFYGMTGGATDNKAMELSGAGNLWIDGVFFPQNQTTRYLGDDGTNLILGAGSDDVKINTTGNTKGLYITATQEDNVGVGLVLKHIHSTPAAGHVCGTIKGVATDDNDVSQDYCAYDLVIEDPAAANPDGKMIWYNMSAGGWNECMRLSSLGLLSCDAAGAGNALPTLFDKYDDVSLVRQALKDVAYSLTQSPIAEKAGLITRKDTGSGWMLNFQPMIYAVAGATYQNRARIDDLVDVLVTEFPQVAKRLVERNLIGVGG